MTQRRQLLNAEGRPVQAADIARVRARAALNMPNPSPFAYDAAALVSQEMPNWLPFLRSPDGEINLDRDRIVARARDLVRNDAWASGGVTRIVDAAVGAHFRLNARPDFRALQRLDNRFDASWAADFAAEAEAEWRLWSDDPNRFADAKRQVTMTQLFHTALRHKLVDGEALAMLLWAPERIGVGAARYATTVALIDPDRLSNPFQRMDAHDMRGGVEIDGLGAPIAYHVRQAHQNEWYDAARSMRWDRFPRETPWGRRIVVHDFDVERDGQHRGVGILTPVLARFKMLAMFDAVSLQAAVLRTLVGFFVKSPYDAQDVQDALDVIRTPEGHDVPENLFGRQAYRDIFHEQNPVLLGGVRMPMLAPGESIETVRPGGEAAEFDAFESAFLRSVATATGQSAEEISNDYRKVNYSSARASLLVAWRTLLRRRTNFGLGFAQPIYAAWLEEAIDRELLPLPRRVSLAEFSAYRAAFARCGWIGPGRGWIDPVKERQGEQMGLEAGFGTLAGSCAEISGADWREVLEQRAVELAEMQRLGIPAPAWAGTNTGPGVATAAEQDA